MFAETLAPAFWLMPTLNRGRAFDVFVVRLSRGWVVVGVYLMCTALLSPAGHLGFQPSPKHTRRV
jgi:hypothetical protein